MSGRYVPRPHRHAGLRIPVHVMRRFFNLLGGGKCCGIEVADRGGKLHSVSIHFDTSAEASAFYREMLAVYDLADEPRRSRMGTVTLTPGTGSP